MNNTIEQTQVRELSPNDKGALYTYALWLGSLVLGAQMIGCDIEEPNLNIYRDLLKDGLTVNDPVAFAAEMFRCGAELSSKLLDMEGDEFPMGCFVFEENARRLKSAKKQHLTACVLGMQYHAWYERTKYICCVVGALCDGPAPWAVQTPVSTGVSDLDPLLAIEAQAALKRAIGGAE